MAGTRRSLAYLESRFQTGDVPTQQDFYDLFRSFVQSPVAGYVRIDMGYYEWNTTHAYPDVGSAVGSADDGSIVQGNEFLLATPATIGSETYPALTILRAMESNPGQTPAKWRIGD